MANDSMVDWQRVATGFTLAVAIALLTWTTTRAGNDDVQEIKKQHESDVSAVLASTEVNRAAIAAADSKLTRLDERSKNQTDQLDKQDKKLDAILKLLK